MSKEKPKDKSRNVTLKRAVTIKAVVTDKFKEYIKFELTEAIKTAKNQLASLEKNAEALKSTAPGTNMDLIDQQVSGEKFQLETNLKDLESRLKSVPDLKNDSLFMQGTIDGFVSVSEGDNLYEKLGGLEILVKDGVVQKIASLTAPS